jgi:hypothetical protein
MFRIASIAMVALAVSSWEAGAANVSCLLDPSQENLMMDKNKRMLETKLRDPSPIYTDTRMNCKSGAPVVCGYVNARNGYGGYVGRQRWIGVLFNASTESLMGPKFQAFWDKHC